MIWKQADSKRAEETLTIRVTYIDFPKTPQMTMESDQPIEHRAIAGISLFL